MTDTRRRFEARGRGGGAVTAVLPWLVAVALMAALFAIFTPGHYSFDAAHLWWMVRHDDFDSTHPPVLGLIWQAARALLPDPAGFFALQLALVGAGLGLVATALPLTRVGQAAFVAALVGWPAFGGLLPQVWKDVWMVGALLVAVGALLHDHRAPNRGWRMLALLALSLAAAIRYNAITGVLPLLAWLLLAERRACIGSAARTRRWRWLLVLPVFAALVALPTFVVSPKPAPAWPFVALWDLAAVEIDTGRAQVPPGLRAPTATRAAFARVFRPDSNVSTVGSGLTLYASDLPLSPGNRRALVRAWVTLPVREPAAYARHRWRLAKHLFGAGNIVRDPGLALMPGIVPLFDNPPLRASAHPLAGRLQASWLRAHATPLFEGRWYLLAAALVALPALRGRRWPALAVAASGLCMVLPLVLAAPSAEFRYLLWLVASTPLALVLLLPTASRSSPRQVGDGPGR